MILLKLIFIFIISSSAYSQLIINDDQNKEIILRNNHILELSSDAPTNINKLLAKPSQWITPKSLNYGYGSRPRWFKLNITNNAATVSIKYLFPMMQKVFIYIIKDGRIVKTSKGGKSLANSEHRAVIASTSHKGNLEVYIYLESSGPMQLPITVGTLSNITSSSLMSYLWIGLSFGIVFALIVYNLFIFITIKEKVYLYYCLYSSSLIPINLSFSGLTYQYFPNMPIYIKSRLVVVAIGLMLIFLILFTKEYFNFTKEKNPKIHQVLNWLLAVPLLLTTINLIQYSSTTISLTGLSGIMIPFAVLFISIYQLRYNKKNTWLFLVATGSVLTGFVIYCLKDFSILPHNFFTTNAFFFSSPLEVTLLGIAIATRMKLIYNENQELLENRLDSEKKYFASMKLGEQAKQLSHDIRSPLAALDIVLTDALDLPEEKRSLVRNATQRINDIADNLLSSYRNPGEQPNNELQSCMLTSLIAPIVAEKRTQFRKFINIDIEANFSGCNYGIFIKINPIEFKRVLSNLINNSIESIVNTGKVLINIKTNGDEVAIEVIDNGSGIPERILPKLMLKGASFGKDKGSGLGLYHAKSSLNQWNGNLTLKSTEGIGTTVSLILPIALEPKWFLKQLNIHTHSEIVILDDDTSIHQVWKSRFSKFDLSNQNIKLRHFSSPDEFKTWFQSKNNDKTYTYLFDYEILGRETTGLDLIIDLNIENSSILITSRYEEKEIINRCEKNKIPLLPKNLATYIPINIYKNNIDAILIDDDQLIREIWSLKAKAKNVNLITFQSKEKFLNRINTIPKDTPIYIDSNLGDGTKGENLALNIFKKGFTCLYLATGYKPENFSRITFLKGVTGKNPPWS